jgi:hypothetical protein
VLRNDLFLMHRVFGYGVSEPHPGRRMPCQFIDDFLNLFVTATVSSEAQLVV